MLKLNSTEKAKLIKDALLIVDKLATLNLLDINDHDMIEELIDKAKKLKKNRLWNLR